MKSTKIRTPEINDDFTVYKNRATQKKIVVK